MQESLNFERDARFDGATIIDEYDTKRLAGLLGRVFNLMADTRWRTLPEIVTVTGGSEASVSARLRDLRKKRFGSHTINRRRRGEAERGLHEYQLIESKEVAVEH